mmetsp:Transcript_42362/g.65011  ORF Transcript_42362/g.65011 Transcript_42362/m.65011 type:complete len:112 (+) Transcript_42362:1190-1525(+)
MLKCCLFSTIVVCFAPVVIRSIRRARRPDADWVPTSTALLKNMMKGKFKPELYEDGVECPICMEEYTANDDVVTLPCNEKHFFHEHCIKDWLKTNNSCPLCKKPITKEDLA